MCVCVGGECQLEALASNVVAGSCPIYFRGEKRICLCS